MKRLTAILFVVLLAWMQVAPVTAMVSAVCLKPAMGNCASCCSRMPCCATKPTPHSQPVPAVPAQSNFQNQISLLAAAVVIWTLPENQAGLFYPASTPPLTAMSAPLYARNCALLL